FGGPTPRRPLRGHEAPDGGRLNPSTLVGKERIEDPVQGWPLDVGPVTAVVVEASLVPPAEQIAHFLQGQPKLTSTLVDDPIDISSAILQDRPSPGDDSCRVAQSLLRGRNMVIDPQ